MSTKTKRPERPSDPKTLLTPQQVALMLSVPERWVWRAMADGRLRKLKVGKYVRVHPDDLADYIAAGRQTDGR
jgi:excisionase family DNA binding protein